MRFLYKPLLLVVLISLLVACTNTPTSNSLPTSTATATRAVEPTATASADNNDAHGHTYDEGYEEYPTPAPASANATLGANMAGFRNRFAVADQFAVKLTALPPLPAGQAYQGWLLGAESAVFNLGLLTPAADGSLDFEWTSPNGENLLGRYDRFQITREPAAGSQAPTGPVVAAGGLDSSALAAARRLFYANTQEPATPLNKPFATALSAQAELADQHLHNADNAAKIGASAEMRLHLEHAINIIEGANGQRFGDYSGDSKAQNPGDGFGVLAYAAQTGHLIQNELAVAELQTQLEGVVDKCIEIVALTDVNQARIEIAAVIKLMEQAQAGPIEELYTAAQQAMLFQVSINQ